MDLFSAFMENVISISLSREWNNFLAIILSIHCSHTFCRKVDHYMNILLYFTLFPLRFYFKYLYLKVHIMICNHTSLDLISFSYKVVNPYTEMGLKIWVQKRYSMCMNPSIWAKEIVAYPYALLCFKMISGLQVDYPVVLIAGVMRGMSHAQQGLVVIPQLSKPWSLLYGG